MALNVAGVVAVLVFYIIILVTGVWAARRSRATERGCQAGQSEMAMVGDRKMSVVVGVFTATATWVGGSYINGTAEVVYTPGLGLAWSQFPLGCSLSLFFGALFFAKPMRMGRYVTMLDPFQIRYGKWLGSLFYIPTAFGDLFWATAVLTALGLHCRLNHQRHTGHRQDHRGHRVSLHHHHLHAPGRSLLCRLHGHHPACLHGRGPGGVCAVCHDEPGGEEHWHHADRNRLPGALAGPPGDQGHHALDRQHALHDAGQHPVAGLLPEGARRRVGHARPGHLLHVGVQHPLARHPLRSHRRGGREHRLEHDDLRPPLAAREGRGGHDLAHRAAAHLPKLHRHHGHRGAGRRGDVVRGLGAPVGWLAVHAQRLHADHPPPAVPRALPQRVQRLRAHRRVLLGPPLQADGRRAAAQLAGAHPLPRLPRGGRPGPPGPSHEDHCHADLADGERRRVLLDEAPVRVRDAARPLGFFERVHRPPGAAAAHRGSRARR
ncbi:uncharacterized protein LOC144950062 isoform X4 [Lampetra fluviatilis]